MALVKHQTPTVQPTHEVELTDAFGSIDRAFDRMVGMWPGFLPWRAAKHWLAEAEMPVNEFYRDGSLVIRVDVPGIDPDKDVDVTVTNGMLDIKAERHQEENIKEEHYVRREVHHGSFERLLSLPEGVTEGDVKATYKDGVLEIVVPQVDAEPAKKITVAKA